jgi:gluconate 2-dehydrogenase
MKPNLLVARPIFQSVIDALAQTFEVTSNQSDTPWTPESWQQAISLHDAALTTGSDPINASVLGRQPRLKIAANMAVGYNNFDVPAMTALGIAASNTPDVLTETTADFGFALLMATARRMTESEHYLRAGLWKQWRYDMFAGAEVHGSTLGIIGMGRIGQGVARRGALGFGMRVIYHNRSQLSPQLEAECKAQYVSKEELLKTADHVVLVVPYSAESHHTIGAKELGMMKPTATLVNIARGGIVDDAALAKALAAGQIAAAGLDVFEGEPALNPELLKVPNVVLTPHIASATTQTRLAMAQLAADNLVAYMTQGRALTPLNAVTKAA